MLDETGQAIVEKLHIIAEALGIDAVRFTEQVLTEAQKAQARQNIGAPGADTIPTKVSDLENDSGFQNASQVATAVAVEASRATAKETEIEAAIPDVSAFITKSVNDLVNYYTKSAIDAILAEKQDDISDIIPTQASSQNKLADKDFVNSSVQTASANFRGNWATKSAIPTDYTLYPADYAGNRKPTTNDYLVVQADESQDGGTWRYKYSGDWDTDGVNGWFAEYEVNETPLTAAQLAALNSGVTSGKVLQYDSYGSGKQDKINDLASIREGAGLGATAVQPSELGAYRTASEQDTIDADKENRNHIDEDTTTTDVSEALVVGKTYKYMPDDGVATLAFTLTPPTEDDVVKFCRFKFKSGATATEFTPPSNLYWPDGEQLLPEANTIYEVMIDEDYCVSVLAFKQATA